jgi:TolB protein
MCVALAAGILAALLVVVLGTPTKRAEAAFPGKNGKIAFVNGCGPACNKAEIATMKPNGDNKTILTHNRVADVAPAFSANGKKIAFESERSGNSDIYTMSANGTDIKRVTTSESREGDPSWSPDGTKIAFQRVRNGNPDIYVINQDGTGLTRLTTSPQFDSSPAWSPDGTRIAFNKNPSEEPSITKIYVMKAARASATNRPQRLTNSGLGVEEGPPAWSPNGTRIAFASDQSGDFELYTIRADGSGQIQLTNSSGGGSPAWSPDGTKIVFSRLRGSARMSVGIYVMKAAPESETNRPKWLAGNRIDSLSPDWQPLR